MKLHIRFTMVATSLVVALSSFSQTRDMAVEKYLSPVLNGKYCGQEIKGKRTGMGALQKGSTFYVGDFKDGKYHGIGMLIQPDSKLMKKCMDAKVYVGEWEDGKMCGEGRLYDTTGKQIYHGIFDNDKPISVISDGSADRTFSAYSKNGCVYIGESVGDNLQGLNIEVGQGGYILALRDKNRAEGLIFMYPSNGMWTMSYSPYPGHSGWWVSSLEVYQKIDGDRKRNMDALWDEAKQEFGKAFSTGMSLASQIRGANNSADSFDDEGYEGGSSGSSTKKRSKASGGKDDKQINGTAWKAKQRAYSDYETQLIKMKGDANKFDPDHYRDIQRKMRAIRLELESKGLPITKSPHENDNP